MAPIIPTVYPPTDLRPELDAIKILIPYQNDLRNNEVQIHRWTAQSGKRGLVAVKFFIDPDKLTHHEILISRMLYERRKSQGEQHARIIKCLRFLDDLDPPGLGTEYCNAGTIKDVVERGAIQEMHVPSHLILHLMQQVAEALHWILKNNLAHGDGHSGNYFLKFEGVDKLPVVKLADFETAYLLNSEHTTKENASRFRIIAWSDVARAAAFFRTMFQDRLHHNGQKPDNRPDIDKTMEHWLDAFFPPCTFGPGILEEDGLDIGPTVFTSHLVDAAARIKASFMHKFVDPVIPIWLKMHFGKLKNQEQDHLVAQPYEFQEGDEESRLSALGRTLEESSWIEEGGPDDAKAQKPRGFVRRLFKGPRPGTKAYTEGYQWVDSSDEQYKQ